MDVVEVDVLVLGDVVFVVIVVVVVVVAAVVVVVKLHSEVALPTELQLDRVGVDFVSPPSQQQVTNPHQNLPEGSVLQPRYLVHRLS